MSRVVVGLAYSAFGDLGAMTTCQSNDATYRRKTLVKKKIKNDASKTLGKWTKKHHDTLEFSKLNIESTCNNL
jgi:hypothetical protein